MIDIHTKPKTKVRVKIINTNDYYKLTMDKLNDEVVEIDKICVCSRPYATVKFQNNYLNQASSSWFYLEDLEYINNQKSECKCELRDLMIRGCRCGGF